MAEAGPPPAARPGRAALTALLAELERPAGLNDSPAGQLLAARRAAYPELPMLDELRETWSRLSTGRQLRQVQALVPGNAGPLNSSHLVNRALSLMQSASPDYLHQFLSYVDALAWLERTQQPAPARGGKAQPRSLKKG